jgi:HD-like signal output (HDOD) protein
MHDIGKLVLNHQVPEVFDEIVQVVYNENQPFNETERRYLGFDHAQVGALLINKWNLSPVLEETILRHHDPAALSPENPLLALLDLGNRMCHKLGIGFVDDAGLDLVALPANQFLSFSPEEFEAIASRLQETLATEMEIFI